MAHKFFEMRVVVYCPKVNAEEGLEELGDLFDGIYGEGAYSALLYDGVSLPVYESLVAAGAIAPSDVGDYVAPEVMNP